MEETAMQQTPSRARRFLCHSLRHHDWHTFSTEDGERYMSCAVCHRDRTGPLGPGAHFGPFA
jgi:hypothetical protein